MKTAVLKAHLLKLKAGLKRLCAAGTLADVLTVLGLDSIAGYVKAVALMAMFLLAVVEMLLALLAKLLAAAGKMVLRYAVKLFLAVAASVLLNVISGAGFQLEINTSKDINHFDF